MTSNNWKIYKLGDLVESISVKHKFDKSKLIFLNTSDILNGSILHHDYSDISAFPGQAKKSIKKGDILYSEIRPKNKRFALVNFDAEDYVVSTKLMVLRRKSEIIDNKYLYLYLTSNQTINYLQSIAEGRSGTFPQITFKQLRDIELKLPEINEQKAIANTLSTLDEKIETNNQINKKLEETAEALFKHWFVDFEFPNENGDPYKSSGGEMVESELGMIPKPWEIKNLGEITTLIIDHRGKTPKKLGGDWSQIGYLAISAKNIKNNRIVRKDDIKYLDEDLYNKWMKDPLDEGDILMTSEAPLGEFLYLAEKEEYVLSQRLYGIRANSKNILPSILFMSMNSTSIKENIINRATGTTVTGIRQSELRKVPIIVPPMKIQEQLNKTINACLKKVYCNERENIKLQLIRDTLLPKIMTGEIRVPINDEVV